MRFASRRSPNVWSVGDRVLALADEAIAFFDDEPEHWLPATIAQVHPYVGVHFDGYGDRWPNHIQWDEIRPAPILGPEPAPLSRKRPCLTCGDSRIIVTDRPGATSPRPCPACAEEG